MISFINFFVYICIELKIDIMKTQADTLRQEICNLEVNLAHAVLHGDAFSQLDLYKRLDIAKSTLINIQ